jgi:hypothetical protein
MRVILSLVLAAITGFVGCWGYAKYNLLDRVTELSRKSTSLCSQRGVATFDRQAALGQFRVMADSVNLEVSEAAVSIEPLDQAAKGGAVGSAVQSTLSGMTAGRVSMKASLVKVTARIRGKKWLWSVDRTIEPSCVLVGKVEYLEDRQVRDAAGEARDRVRTIMGGRQ